MGTVNQGGQRIGWKYSTPLQAEYLNTFIAGMTTPGLVERPKFDLSVGQQSTTVTIPSGLKMFIRPKDHPEYLVKITTTSPYSLPISSETKAIGFKFQFSPDGGVAQSQWFGDFEALAENHFTGGDMTYREGGTGLVIATVMCKEDQNQYFYHVSANGADISDCLLREEGWNPWHWLSLVSPRRALSNGKIIYNKLEVRQHNKAFEGAINGIKGCVMFPNNSSSIVWNVPVTGTDPTGEWAHGIANYYTLFKFNTSGLNADKGQNAFPIEKTGGSVFAYGDKGFWGSTPTAAQTFMNNYELHPVVKEDVNVWFDEVTETLYIS